MALQSYANLTNEQRIYYDDLLLDRALPNLVHTKWATKKDIPANMGDRINFRRFELINSAPTSVTALTEGTAGAQGSPSISSVTATISQYGRWFPGTELLEDISIDQVLTEYTEMMGEQAGIDIDVVTREVIVAGSSIQYASTATSRGGVGSGMLLNSAEIREVVRVLKGNNARAAEDGKFIAIVHPNAWADLQNDTDWKNAVQYAAPRDQNNPLFSGDAYDYLGVRFVLTSQARVFSSLGLSGADVYATLVMGNQAYGVSNLANESLRTYYKPRGSSGTADPLDQQWTLGEFVAQVKPAKLRGHLRVKTILNQSSLLQFPGVAMRGATTRRQGLRLVA